MKNTSKKKGIRSLALALALTLALPLTSLATVEELNKDTTLPGQSLTNKFPAYQDIALQISLTEDADLEVVIPTEKTKEELSAAIQARTLKLSLTRDKSRGYMDPEKFPFAKDGGPLESWKTEKEEPLFTDVKFEVVEDTKLKVTMKSHCFFWNEELYDLPGKAGYDYSTPHTNGQYWIDSCGYFDLTASIDGTEIGSAHAKVVPYDSYRTIYELYDEVDDLVKNHLDDRYIARMSLGQTTKLGYDTPMLVIAKDKESVDQWLAYTELAETNPEEALRQIESGKLSHLKVPMLVTNCHANENSPVNGILTFARMMATQETVTDFQKITGLTTAGVERIKQERNQFNSALPAYMKDFATEYGFIRGEKGILKTEDGLLGISAQVDLQKYYTLQNETLKTADLLEDVIFLVVPTMNIVGYENGTRATSAGYDPNRDEANQSMYEDANLQHTIGTWNPMVYDEIHGRIEGHLIEPCTPPHEPNYEYDLIAKPFVELGESLGSAAIANNSQYNSFEMPARDYLHKDADSPSGVVWDAPWDDSTTACGAQFPPLTGTCGITWEQPAYNDESAERIIPYGLLGQAKYIQENKELLLTTQAKVFQRGVTNMNSNELVAPYFVDQYDRPSAEQAALVRPVYDGEGQNGNFYPECFLIPMDQTNQRNLEDAAEAMKYLTRNDVKVHVAKEGFSYNGVDYPAGTMIVPMYQAKRSIAHSQLFPGTFINIWTGLFAESFAQQPYARGYDIVTVAEPAAYQTIMKACGEALTYETAMDYLKGYHGAFQGVQNADVIIENASEDAVMAVNALLRAGKKVGMITEGPDRGDFICSYADYMTIADTYILSAQGVFGGDYTARLLEKSPLPFLTGKLPARTEGYSGFAAWSFVYNFDMVAMERMGFEVADTLAEADAVIGASAPTEEVLAAVRAGKPYLLWGGAASHIETIVPGATIANCNDGVDMLARVEYPTDSLVNASFIKEGDDVMYQYGVNYFNTLPTGAQVLVKNSGKEPLQGCITTITDEEKANFDAYNNGVVAFAYQQNNMDVVAFANTLTHKGHQSDDYTFISNFLFEQVMGDTAYVGQKAADIHFQDVQTGDFFYDAVLWAVQNGITNGTAEATFSPNMSCTRAQMVTFLWKAAGSPAPANSSNPFTDVKNDSYYAKAVLWATEQGITGGTGADSFSPDMTCTRAQAVTFLYRTAKSPAVSGSLSFSDVDSGAYYADAVNWATQQEITSGTGDGSFHPDGDCTRSQIVTFLYRYMGK